MGARDVTTTEVVRIRRAEPQDAAALAELATRTFRDTFGADNRPEDLEVHLAEAYGETRQLRELLAADVRTLVAVNGGALVAFAQLRDGDQPGSVTAADAVELWRFYVDRPWHGQGVAQRLMRAVLGEARAMGAESVWLGVWEHNPRALAFYREFGFVAVGVHEFLLGQDRQNDVVMLLTPLPGP